jgi:hypothetical protein
MDSRQNPLNDRTNSFQNRANTELHHSYTTKPSTSKSGGYSSKEKSYSTIHEAIGDKKHQSHFVSGQGQGQGGGFENAHASEVQSYLSNHDIVMPPKQSSYTTTSASLEASKRLSQSKTNGRDSKHAQAKNTQKSKPKTSLQAHMHISISGGSSTATGQAKNSQLIERPSSNLAHPKYQPLSSSTGFSQNRAPSVQQQQRTKS